MLIWDDVRNSLVHFEAEQRRDEEKRESSIQENKSNKS